MRCIALLSLIVTVSAIARKPVCNISGTTRNQDGEEAILVDLFFHDVFNGVFVEIGALDGLTVSNTFYLEKCQEWTGLLVEGSGTTWQKLMENMPQRPGARARKVAVCAPPTKAVNFTIGRFDTGGVWNAMSKSFKNMYTPGQEVPLEEVPCAPMSEIFKPLKHIDLWSLDVEGSEFEAVFTVDWDAVQIDVIIIELDEHDPAKNWKVRKMLHTVGYAECSWGTIHRSGLFVSKKSRYSCAPVGEQKCICSFEDCFACRSVRWPPRRKVRRTSDFVSRRQLTRKEGESVIQDA